MLSNLNNKIWKHLHKEVRKMTQQKMNIVRDFCHFEATGAEWQTSPKNSIFLAYEIHKFSKHYNSKKASKGRRKHAHRCVQCPKAQSVIIIKWLEEPRTWIFKKTTNVISYVSCVLYSVFVINYSQKIKNKF